MTQWRLGLGALAALVLVAASYLTVSAAPWRAARPPAPATVSEAFREFYAARSTPRRVLRLPGPDDAQAWRTLWEATEARSLPRAEAEAARLGVTVAPRRIAGVPVIEVTPPGWTESGRRLVYAHGGGYTLYSARSTLGTAALVAAATGLRVVSIDYTNPPRARWREVTGEVAGVVSALADEGFGMAGLALFGDSAGGSLVAGAALRLRDDGGGVPAAVVLWSPWADITETGDSYATLARADPILDYARVLAPSAAAYADPEDHGHPYVSPVHGDFAKGFAPTLIQCGTREIFLSNCVRLQRAIEVGGVPAVLDLHEGMPHGFPSQRPEAPETAAALATMADFLRRAFGG